MQATTFDNAGNLGCKFQKQHYLEFATDFQGNPYQIKYPEVAEKLRTERRQTQQQVSKADKLSE